MMTFTHIAISATMTSLILGTSRAEIVLIGALAGILADVDISTSLAGRILFPISKYLEKRYPHRSITHSFLASITLGLVAHLVCFLFQFPMAIAQALVIGYTAGWFADIFTVSGTQVFYPARVWCVCPGNRKLRLSTGSNGEYVLLFIVTAFALTVFYFNSTGGIGMQFNNLLGTTTGVEDLYNKKGSDYIIKTHVQGVRAIDRQPINGDYRLIQSSGLGYIVKDKQGLYKVGNEADVQIISQKIVASTGVKATTRVQQIVFNDQAIAPQLKALVDANLGTEIYLTGNLKIDNPEDIILANDPKFFSTIVKAEGTLQLNAAPIQDVYQLAGEEWATGQVTARVVYILAIDQDV